MARHVDGCITRRQKKKKKKRVAHRHIIGTGAAHMAAAASSASYGDHHSRIAPGSIEKSRYQWRIWMLVGNIGAARCRGSVAAIM